MSTIPTRTLTPAIGGVVEGVQDDIGHDFIQGEVEGVESAPGDFVQVAKLPDDPVQPLDFF